MICHGDNLPVAAAWADCTIGPRTASYVRTGHTRCITLLKAGGPSDTQAPTAMAAAIDVRFM